MNIIKQVTDRHMPDKDAIRINAMTSAAPRRAFKIYAVLVAVMMLAVCTMIAVPFMVNRPDTPPMHDCTEDILPPETTLNTDTTERVTLSTYPGYPWGEIDEPEEGIYIPPMELHQPEHGGSYDVIGLVVYGGKVYTQAEYIKCDYDEKQKYIGEYLGTAKDNYGCLINPEDEPVDFTEDFTSSVPGDVYTVKGYNPAFRICIPEMRKGCDFIAFFECVNGITIATGEDLYGAQRLNIKENYSKVYSHVNAYVYANAEEGTEPAELSEEAMILFPKFIDKLLSSEFAEYRPDGTLYEREHIMLYIEMNDGSTTEIGLFPDGYVHYFNMYGYVMVKIEDEVFNEFYNLIK